MNQDFAQRRRVAVALAITVIAVPAAFLLNRTGDTSTPPVGTVIGSVVSDQPGSGASLAPAADTGQPLDAASATDAMGTTPVGFLDGTVPARDSDPATIAIPRLPRSINGTGSFDREITDTKQCTAKGIPLNSRITVTNRDNSRSVSCINTVEASPSDADVILNADAFLLIADLTDAPIAVQITW